MNRHKKLNIEFHNPNAQEGISAALVKLAAELVKAKVKQAITNQKEKPGADISGAV